MSGRRAPPDRGPRAEHGRTGPSPTARGDGGTLRVLHVIYDHPDNPWVGGGGAVRVFELYRRLAGRVEATVACGSYPGARDGVREGVRYRHLGARRPYAWSRITYAVAANALLRRASYDAAVFDFSTYTPVFVPTDRPAGITVHHVTGAGASTRWGSLPGAAIAAMERRMIRRGSRLSATSEATRRELREATDLQIDTVLAGVPDELFEIRRRPESFVLYFGRLDVAHKGIDTLLHAFVPLARERPELELRIAGRGRDAAQVVELARSLGIAERVRLLGPVSDEIRGALYATAAVQVLPSRFEGFGMVAAEAMAAGVPLVATSVGSLPEVVAPPAGGVLVAPDDPAALAGAVAALLDDPARRAALSASARASAERFRWARVAEDHLLFLRRVMTRSHERMET